MVGILKNPEDQKVQDAFEKARKDAEKINTALRNGDFATAEKGLKNYQANKYAYEKAGYNENRFLNESMNGVTDQAVLNQFFRIALEVGFTTAAVLSAAILADRSNDTRATAALAASNASFGQALIALIKDYIDKETDDAIKKDLLTKKDSLSNKLEIGGIELSEGSKEFKKYVDKIDDILKDKTEIKLLSALYLHSNLKTPLKNAFAAKSPIEES
jgi:hypothetical protein